MADSTTIDFADLRAGQRIKPPLWRRILRRPWTVDVHVRPRSRSAPTFGDTPPRKLTLEPGWYLLVVEHPDSLALYAVGPPATSSRRLL